MNKIEHHPLSKIVPMMNEAQFEPFKNGMKKFGYDKSKPITLYEGKILDGRNRARSGMELGLNVPTQDFIPNGRTALDFIVQENLNRRHLSTGQIGFIALNVYDALKEQYMQNDWKGAPTEFKGKCNFKRAETVSKMFGIGRNSVTSAITIRRYSPQLMSQVVSGSINISKALKLLPKIRNVNKQHEDDQLAVKILKEFNPKCFVMPSVYDSYEKFFGEHFKKLNDSGFMMQAVFCSRKIYVQIVKLNESFRPWGNKRSEYDFRLAVIACMKDIKI